MITEDYVSFETAKLLKKKGLKENVLLPIMVMENCMSLIKR